MEVDTDGDEKTLNVEMTTMNLENDEEPVNKVAKICSSEVSDVFPIFANMLDAKSFMNLAMTCKGMYKRCMEDKAIKINVDQRYINVYCDDGGVGFSIHSLMSGNKYSRSYVATLRKHRFSLNANSVYLNGTPDANIPILKPALKCLKDIGVKSIKDLTIYQVFSDWEEALPFIQEFRVSILCIYRSSVPLPILRSLLQLDLEKFSYYESFPVEIFLDVDSPIRQIKLPGLQNIEWNEFMQMSWKIQSGPLQRLTLSRNAVNWTNDEPLMFDEEDELPEHRPLVFQLETDRFWNVDEGNFFLHWQGGVTKCTVEYRATEMEIVKCPPNEFPPILRNDEDVLKDLAEMVPKVSCYERQFNSFMEKFTLIEPSYEGPLPTERPLYFKAENGFWKLTEDDVLMECVWRDGIATWESDRLFRREPYGYRALAKLMFNKYIHEADKYFDGGYMCGLGCSGLEEFNFWLEDYKKLDFEYTGPLPEERPLVFEKAASEDGYKKRCFILVDDDLLECYLYDNEVNVNYCEPWTLPPILIDAEKLMKILQQHFLDERGGVRIRVDHETFLKGFELFKTTYYGRKSRLPLVFEKTQNIDGNLVEERWFDNARGLTKIAWKDGYASLSDGDHHEVPFEFVKELFKECVQELSLYECRMFEFCPKLEYTGLSMHLEQFESCLELFETHPFDYDGPLSKDRVLAFVKKEIHHICEDGQATLANCGCPEPFIRVWFLSCDSHVSYCSWSPIHRRVMFNHCRQDLPPILKSRKYLKNLLEAHELEHEKWLGSFDELLACFEDYKKISSSHKGPLPAERPIFVEQDTERNHARYLLHEDGGITRCEWSGDSATITTIHPFVGMVPSVLLSAL